VPRRTTFKEKLLGLIWRDESGGTGTAHVLLKVEEEAAATYGATGCQNDFPGGGRTSRGHLRRAVGED